MSADAHGSSRAATDTTSASGVQAPEAGPGRLFTLLYGTFAVGATSRAGVELATKFSAAPIAYTLSAFSAAVYVVGLVLLLRWGHRGSREAMRVLCLVELTGVLTVGTLSLVRPEWFPDNSVWSYYGAGYLLLPAILPILVLRWLARTRPDASATDHS
ncbi:hypothetical protein [Mobilicoccus pelagius]|uniref:Integral membrane protein n=1 Tax=Mobilicoccus pelagius NBRC 104925 TaxID=1089455 RepID=H5UTD1_9MICO|nr:hypothetical protein [Mobilicoccus pelagius]GAB48989.1 hypothetical protein MOPEL_094_00060 [Mobilicoccus pelagius NBRC 104925]